MKKKKRKNKTKYKNEIRKRQIANISSEKKITEDDCGVSDESLNRMKDKMSEMTGGIEHKLVRDSSLEKMSEILLEYAKPFMDTIELDNKKEYEKAVILAMTLWNCSIMEEDPKNRKAAKEMLKPLMRDAESKSVMNYMLERKRQMYPNNKRMIMNYELTETPDGFNLSVASLLSDEIG